MSLVVAILGTNCTGKTTLAKSLINAYGGARGYGNDITFCASEHPSIVFAGKYTEGKYGGVDGLSRTRDLPQIAASALMNNDVFVCEGLKLHSFGMNVINTLFSAKNQLVVYLYAPLEIIDQRLKKRSLRGIGITKAIASDNRNTLNAVKKYKSIGVPVLAFDTSKSQTEDICKIIKQYIDEQVLSKSKMD